MAMVNIQKQVQNVALFFLLVLFFLLNASLGPGLRESENLDNN